MTQLGRVFVVTGSNRGIGFQTVRELCRRTKGENATVILCSRDAERGQEAMSKLRNEGLHASLGILDIASEESRKKFVGAVQRKYQHVDCLINNAGIMLPHRSMKSLKEEAEMTCAVNYYGTREVTMSLLPLMRPNARVLFVAARLGQACLQSMSEFNRLRLIGPSVTLTDLDHAVADYIDHADDWKKEGWPKLPYGFSKAAVIGLTQVLARSVDAQQSSTNAKGIIMTSVCPGWCKTDLGGQAAPQPPEAGGRLVAQLALAVGKNEHGKFVVDLPK